ncbi:transcriptional regulator, LacI family [Beutenbergia cavernae DSM 12333]|uniref:Transcriptional regulator, LacI family n=1 Tax=Beutenbergia cavernae (strain ATCC BAA-8 / DSM 12333 / CCUG 43141 / JCM 11478 / NBRC 16432 / NCIMB 13614 / HKI 0122) TaxID=471853 RepID=C5BWB5_BEUC1|nr:LacI family DNA-binding transcriptional regulator [Beutenbergia cavernae]ACQ78573.1 transcriptional regulator, LacI family [Beutenbergia cavernae DSM 12333]
MAVTIYEIARRAGVGVSTVSRYLNSSGYVGADAARRIAAVVEETGYVSSRAASSLTTKRSGAIGFVTSSLLNPFAAELAHAMAAEAASEGFSVLSAVTDGDDDRLVHVLRDLRSHRVDGVIVTPPETPAVREELARTVASGVPVTTIGMAIPDAAHDEVSTDTYGGALDAVRHLLEQGHRAIAVVAGPDPERVAASRFRAYRDALDAAGLAVRAELVPATALDREGGAEAAARLFALDAPPTAVFAANDLAALGVLQAAHEAGLRVPDDLSVVGFDDIAMASHATPPLTTVRQPKTAMGVRAVRLLLDRIAEPEREPRSERLECELVVRASVAPPRRGREGAATDL